MTKYLFLFICFLLMPFCYSQSAHTITLNSSNNVASLLMSTTEYNSWKTNNDFRNASIRQELFKDIYKTFKDDFDFAFLVLNETATPSGMPVGELLPVSNNVTNIGLSSYNDTSKYGSAGKLKAVMSISKLSAVKNGPSLHELMHNWGNFILTTNWVNANGSGSVISLISDYKPHWGFTGGSSKGQLGGFNQADLQFVNIDANKQYFAKEFGGNANGGNVVPYSEFELYLMGMIPLAEVKPFDVITGTTWYEKANENWDVYFNGTKTTYTPAKIEADFGVRTPTVTTSQKDFKLLIVVLTPAPLTQSQLDSITAGSTWFSAKQDDGTSFYNFWEATGGRGSIETSKLDQSLLSLSVNNYEITQHIRIYPNPANKILNIESEAQIFNISVVNSNGQQMEVKNVVLPNNKISLDVSSYSPGIYLFKVKNAFGNESVKKIVVE